LFVVLGKLYDMLKMTLKQR